MSAAESIPILLFPVTIQACILSHLDSFETLENVCSASETLWHTHNSFRDYIHRGIALSSIEALDQALFTARTLSLSEQYPNTSYATIIITIQRAPPNEIPLPLEGYLLEPLILQDEGVSEVAGMIFNTIPKVKRSGLGAHLMSPQPGAPSITLEQVKSVLYRLRVLLGFLLESAPLMTAKHQIPPGVSGFINTFSPSERSIFSLVFAIFHAAYLDVTDYHLESDRGDTPQGHMSGLRDTLERFLSGGTRSGKTEWLRRQGHRADADLVTLWLLLFLNDSEGSERPSQIVFQALRPMIIVRELVTLRARERESLTGSEISR
ncbi:hypothetical protein L873DRAFT_1788921 [Choiromyces venosus 120613-1]|uniref:Uncharacterized protein n=1 Tax=Choiromyces venosus 120613-1 TaxID=1336337 RepID=A0A3N4JUN2_9PEZI|nr:hypothetical protein L873DRAFT_1788921 [Choiromyces venosus 120613-1]